jgi:hypothetical protein
MCDAFHVFVVLDGLKNEKKSFEMHHGERAKIVEDVHQQPRPDLKLVDHDNFSCSVSTTLELRVVTKHFNHMHSLRIRILLVSMHYIRITHLYTTELEINAML